MPPADNRTAKAASKCRTSEGEAVAKYLITVSTASRHGRTKLHTFGKETEAEHLRWFIETHSSRKELNQRKVPGVPLPTPWPPPPRRDLGAAYYDELPSGSLHLAEGVDISGDTLTVVLDALRSAQRHEVDLDDLRRVVSQCGGRISNLEQLSGGNRSLAEQALHAAILRECSPVS